MTAPLCPARLAYRGMSDIGSQRTCGNKVVSSSGFCKRHDPETAPRRDKRGRILPKEPAPAVVAESGTFECWTCCNAVDRGPKRDAVNHVRYTIRRAGRRINDSHGLTVTLCGAAPTSWDVDSKGATWAACLDCHRSLGHDVREVPNA